MEASPPPSQLDVRSSLEHGCVVLRLEGELDSWSAPVLEDAARAALDAKAPELKLDLGGLTFVDSIGMRALLRVHLLARDHAVPFSIRNATHEAVSRVMALVHIGRHVGIE